MFRVEGWGFRVCLTKSLKVCWGFIGSVLKIMVPFSGSLNVRGRLITVDPKGTTYFREEGLGLRLFVRVFLSEGGFMGGRMG